MAESKKSSTGKGKPKTNAEMAEALRLMAEALEGTKSDKPAAKKSTGTKSKSTGTKSAGAKSTGAKSTAKKPAAKKPAAKEPADEQPTEPEAPEETPADKPKAPAKKPTTKKPATKAVKAEDTAEEQKAEPVAEQPVEEPVAEQPAEEPVEQPVEPVAEQPAEEPAAQPVDEPVAEQPVAEPAAQPAEELVAEQPVEQSAETPAPAPAPTPSKKAAFAAKANVALDKSHEFIHNKGKLPLFIVANALLFLSSLFLMLGAFSIPNPFPYMNNGKPVTGTLFTYLSNADTIKMYWVGTAGEWTNGGYVMIGILMFLSFLVPLALLVKNVLFFILKKDKNVHMLDAIITFAFLVAYLGIYNLYGANPTWGQTLSLIFSIVLLAYTIFVILLQNRGGMFPFFSIANLVMIMLCTFLLTSNAIYNVKGWYGAYAAGHSVGGGFAFIMLLACIAALVLLTVMQVKKLPGKIAWLFEFLVPAAVGVLALIALISFAGGKPKGFGMGGGYVFGSILTMLFAIADVVFALVPKLHKYVVKVADKIQPAAQPVEQPMEQPVEQPAEQPVEQPEQPAATSGKKYCPACGMENGADARFCMKCGKQLQ
ncbi:MAG: zinc-ribbon domain-containing protein [Clostridiales bacterium]|nr:zinc-ribbon domain-containing protein [Clostridiales bacterium]